MSLKVVTGNSEDGCAELAEAINVLRNTEANLVQIVLSKREEILGIDLLPNLQAVAERLSAFGEYFAASHISETQRQIVMQVWNMTP